MTTLAWTAAAVALALLAWGAWSAYAVWVELRRIRALLDKVTTDQRGMRLQLANLLGMLLRAGFKRGPSRDWSDDEQKTQVHGQSTDTSWDWRKPDAG